MPKKAKEKTKEGTTIVREFIETRFKEIKPEKIEEAEESTEEKQAEPSEQEENFSDFTASNRKFISLKSEQASESLERTAESAPPIKKDENASENAVDLYSNKKYDSKYDSEKYARNELSISPTLFSATNDKETRNLLSRNNPQAQFQDRFAETWQDNRREERQYESIERKSKEEDKVRLEKRKRMQMR